MNRAKSPLLALIIIFGGILLFVVWPRSHKQSPVPVAEKISTNRSGKTVGKVANQPSDEKIQPLEQAYKSLKDSTDPSVTRKLLGDLKQTFAGDKAQASGIIRNFLDTHKDAPTHGSFSVGGNGFLNDAPTLRVFLLVCVAIRKCSPNGRYRWHQKTSGIKRVDQAFRDDLIVAVFPDQVREHCNCFGWIIKEKSLRLLKL
jgi:hypothetical protein